MSSQFDLLRASGQLLLSVKYLSRSVWCDRKSDHRSRDPAKLPWTFSLACVQRLFPAIVLLTLVLCSGCILCRTPAPLCLFSLQFFAGLFYFFQILLFYFCKSFWTQSVYKMLDKIRPYCIKFGLTLHPQLVVIEKLKHYQVDWDTAWIKSCDFIQTLFFFFFW